MAAGAHARQSPAVPSSDEAWYGHGVWQHERGDPARHIVQGLEASGSREALVVKYLVVIEKGRRGWGAHVPDLPGCIAAAKSKSAVLKLIKTSIEFHIEGLKADGRRVPRPHSEGRVVEVTAA